MSRLAGRIRQLERRAPPRPCPCQAGPIEYYEVGSVADEAALPPLEPCTCPPGRGRVRRIITVVPPTAVSARTESSNPYPA